MAIETAYFMVPAQIGQMSDFGTARLIESVATFTTEDDREAALKRCAIGHPYFEVTIKDDSVPAHLQLDLQQTVISAGNLLAACTTSDAVPVHPCPAPEAQWWASKNDEVLEVGPMVTREAAIDEALGQGAYYDALRDGVDPAKAAPADYEAHFNVGRFERVHVDLCHLFDADQWLESLMVTLAENYSDEDGNHDPLDDLSRDDIAALQDMVRAAIWHWQHSRKLPLPAYHMTPVGEMEAVVRPLPDVGGAHDAG